MAKGLFPFLFKKEIFKHRFFRRNRNTVWRFEYEVFLSWPIIMIP